ncbi:MAG: hypothetical protein ACT6FF_09600 [Methanosarcinaceae archaeon]
MNTKNILVIARRSLQKMVLLVVSFIILMRLGYYSVIYSTSCRIPLVYMPEVPPDI